MLHVAVRPDDFVNGRPRMDSPVDQLKLIRGIMPEHWATEDLQLAAEQSWHAATVLIANKDGVIRSCFGALPDGLHASDCLGKHWPELFVGFRQMPISLLPESRQFLFVSDDDKQAYRVVVRERVRLDGTDRESGNGCSRTAVVMENCSVAEAQVLEELGNALRIGRTAAEFAHELNNTLTTVLGWLQILEQELPAEQRGGEPLQMISTEMKRAARAAAGMLSAANGAAAAGHRPLDLNAVVGNVLTLVEPRLAQSSIRLEREFGNVPIVHGCEDELKQVFVNLLLNAAKAIETKGTVRVTTDTSATGHARVQVSDTGCGIPADRLERIFDPCYTTRADSGGTGLGLHVSREIIRRHNGEIRVNSIPGKGSTFMVVLRARQ